MSPKKPTYRPRSRINQYLPSQKFAADSLSDGYLEKLKVSDPDAYDYMLRFIEAEAGGHPELFYKDKANKRRCWRQNTRGALNAAVYTVGEYNEETDSIADSPEDAVNKLIDARHVIHQLEIKAAEAEAERLEPKRKKRRRLKKRKTPGPRQGSP